MGSGGPVAAACQPYRERMARDLARLRDALSPTLLDRLVRRTRPDWTRTALARRLAACALTAVAVVLAVRGDPGQDRVPIVTATRDLAPGDVLTGTDLTLTEVASASLPEGALRAIDEGVGHTLVGPARSGEIVTDVRLLGPRLADAAAGPDARLVPVRIEDAEVAGLVRVGDRVDILAVDAEGSGPPRVLATAAAVVLVGEQGGGRAVRAPVLLAALPAPTANAVAAASLTGAVTVTLH